MANGRNNRPKSVSFGATGTAPASTSGGPEGLSGASNVVSAMVKKRKALEASLGVELPDLGEPAATPLFHQPFVGLVNRGATCYMNALLQTLFTTPEIRKHIVEFPFDVKQQHARNAAYHLQLLFAKMQDATVRNHCTTKELMDSFGMGQDAHREQHDVQELNRVLMDVLQEFIDKHVERSMPPAAGAAADATGMPPAEKSRVIKTNGEEHQVIRYLYRGTLLDVLKCQNCLEVRTTSSPFLDIVLPLCSMMGEAYDEQANIHIHCLEDCLHRFVGKEVIEDVECDSCHGRHAVEKHQQFTLRGLPRVLTIQLVRLQYNIETGRRDKVQKDIRMPLVLDMATWCGDESSSRQQHDDNEAATTLKRHRDREHEDVDGPASRFRLHAIICHRGTPYHGHYYAFVRCYPNEKDATPFWVKFDDETVERVSDEDVLEYTDPAAWRQLQDEAQPMASNSADTNEEAIASVSPMGPVNNKEHPNEEDIDLFLNGPIGSMFDEQPTSNVGSASSSVVGPRTSPSASRSKRVSGHTYYAMYRRWDLPLFTGEERYDFPDSVRSSLEPERLQRLQDIEALQQMGSVVPVSVWVGDVDAALTSALRRKYASPSSGGISSGAFSTTIPPVDAGTVAGGEGGGIASSQPTVEDNTYYALKQIWIDAQWHWTVSDLMAAVKKCIGEDDALLSDPWCIRLICDEPCRLREFSRAMGVMGAVYGGGESNCQLLSEFCSKKRNIENHVAIQILPPKDSLQASVWCATERVVPNGTLKFDNALQVYAQAPNNASSFPVHLRSVLCCPHGCTVEEFKVLASEVTGICVEDQVVTAVVCGQPVVRTRGILVGEPVYVERKEAGRAVGNPSSASQLLLAEDATALGVDDGGEAIEEVLLPSRAMEVVLESYCMDVECVDCPNDVPADDILLYIKNFPSDAVDVIRVDRRWTVRQLKQRVMRLFHVIRGDASEHHVREQEDAAVSGRPTSEREFQLWFDKAVGEPKYLDSTLYTMCMGALRCRVALVHRPMLAEDQRVVEVLLMNTSPVVDYANPTTFITRICIGVETTVDQVIQQALPNEPKYCVDEDEHATHATFQYALRPRLIPSGKTAGFGVPMLRPIVCENALRHSASDVLRVVLQRLPAPECPLEKGSLVLHTHVWRASEPDVAAALGPECEVLFNKELSASALKDQLSELYDIPLVDMQVAPAKLYMLQTHDSAYGKVPWDVFFDEKVLAKAVAAYPLCLDHDDIILIRNRNDPWPYVSEQAKAQGFFVLHGCGGSSGFGTTSARFGGGHGRRPKSPAAPPRPVNDGSPSGDVVSEGVGTTAGGATASLPSTKSKKARSEGGIRIQAVWDYTEPEDVSGRNDGEAATRLNGSPGSPIAVGSLFDDAGSPHGEQAAGDTASPLIDFLESCPFQSSVHKALEETCKVCYAEFEDNEIVCILPSCHHVFHRDCLAPWLPEHPTCPLCRVSVL